MFWSVPCFALTGYSDIGGLKEGEGGHALILEKTPQECPLRRPFERTKPIKVPSRVLFQLMISDYLKKETAYSSELGLLTSYIFTL